MMLIRRKLLEEPRATYLWLVRAMIIVLLLLLGFPSFVAARTTLAHLCNVTDSNMNGSTYQGNLELLSKVLSRSASSKQTLLTKGSIGTNQDRTYGVAVCHGDIAALTPACPSCITTAFHDAWRRCGSHDTHLLYEDCIVHISTTDLIYDSNVVLKRLLIFTDNIVEISAPMPMEVSDKYTDVNIDYNIKVLLEEIAKQAAYNSTTRYVTGRMDVNNTFPLLYCLAQCNLDLPPGDCWDCLYYIRSTTKSFLYQQRGEWIAGTWCNLRYSPFPFYEGQPMKQISWSDSVDPTPNMTTPQPAPGPDSVDPTPNMTTPQPAPGPVGVPRQKDENKPVVLPRLMGRLE